MGKLILKQAKGLSYKDEEDALLYTMLDKRFFSVWRNPSKELWKMTELELFITPDCNLACEYCYLHKYKSSLYPKEFTGKRTILSNLHKLLSWMKDERFCINELQLFSGEIWHLPFGFEVLDILLSYVEAGLCINRIMLPTNSSFAGNDESLAKMQAVIDRFARAGCRFTISHSIEGKPLEDLSRPLLGGEGNRDDAFYDKLFAFAKRNTFYFHPMVAAANIEHWVDNYKWFKEMCGKYGILFPRSVMMLEVRNSDWTEEKLEHLKKYYKYQIDEIKEISGGCFDKFLAMSMGICGDNSEAAFDGYSNIAMPLAKTQAACSIPSAMTVRVGDLAIAPCHRLAYPHLLYGKFTTDNDGINGIEAVNSQIAAKILYGNGLASHHGCDICAYKGICMRCCYGEQYEAIKEPFMPDTNVCNMFKTKFNYLIDEYRDIGLLDYMARISPADTRYIMCQDILREVDRINEARRNGNV